MADLASIRTKVRNTSGSTMFFGFLGKHGVSLIDDEYYSFVGDLKSLVAGNARKEASLNKTLESGDLRIINDPHHVLRDAGDETIRHRVTTSGTSAVANLDSGAYTDS